ncbi:hypothetical protein [Alloactinosynnema sp. L-07]|uniref:hypothetical protein n=1 Tax=Alloactinosynnema sp. L-07 TaxID=1653480 RepID=UPI00065F09E1|nr:hypothetical protein [Alloactinosynnema sp. L-07]CRK54987.1 hypothetical protein [Alloactinosynnema sp. L-07]
MKLTKIDVTTSGFKSSDLWSGTLAAGEVGKLVEAPIDTLNAAGLDLAADADVSVQLDRSAAKAKGGVGVLVIVLEDGTVIIIIVAM